MNTTILCTAKTIFLLVLCSGVVLAAPQQNIKDRDAITIKSYNNNDGSGSYAFGFETSNGIKRDEAGDLNNRGTDRESLVVKGSYSYIAPDGNRYYVEYTADENGYRPSAPRISPAGTSGGLIG